MEQPDPGPELLGGGLRDQGLPRAEQGLYVLAKQAEVAYVEFVYHLAGIPKYLRVIKTTIPAALFCSERSLEGIDVRTAKTKISV